MQLPDNALFVLGRHAQVVNSDRAIWLDRTPDLVGQLTQHSVNLRVYLAKIDGANSEMFRIKTVSEALGGQLPKGIKPVMVVKLKRERRHR